MTCRIAVAVLGLLLMGSAQASVVLTFFHASDYNSNTAAMNTTLGLTGDTFDTFESTTLLPGLTINMGGFGVPSTTLTALPALFNENTCGTLTQNAAWDGTDTVINIPANTPSNCSSPANIAKTITFDYAPGTTTFGIGMGNFQSLNAPQFPFTNHELFVNGVDEGTIETLAGKNWTPGFQRNAYLVITGTGGTTITSVGFGNLSATDVLMFDHLAVAPAAAVPEPGYAVLLAMGLVSGFVWRRRRAC
jgi:hypothetical protein